MKRLLLLAICVALLPQLGLSQAEVGTWTANSSLGNLGNSTPSSGSLAGAGWLTYSLTLNSDGTFIATGANIYDDSPYGDGDGIINYSGTYTTDDSQTPAHIDLTVLVSDNIFFTTDPALQPCQPGIYEISAGGNEFTVQYGSAEYGIPRPAEFMTDSTGAYDSGTLVMLNGVEEGATWIGDATAGDLGNATPSSGSLAGAGWLTYSLTLNSDGSFAVTGANIYDDPPYGDGDGIINYSGTYTTDISQTPAHIDLTVLVSDNIFFTTDPALQPAQPGIFEIGNAGNAITIQYGSTEYGIPRPTEFMTDSTGAYDSGTLVRQIEVTELGSWIANSSTGYLGNATPSSGSLAGAGWLSYSLTLNSDGTFAVTGANIYDDPPYGDGDGIINYSGTYTTDDSQTPAYIDLTVLVSDNIFFTTDPALQPAQPGIYEIGSAGYEFTIQYGSTEYGIPRPTEFMTDSTGAYECGTLVKVVTGVEENRAITPAVFELRQNFPNPFNATTAIEFTLRESGHVALTVYDLLGREVIRLVDGHREAGSHRASWNASAVATGIYFYRLQAAGAEITRKMVLMK